MKGKARRTTKLKLVGVELTREFESRLKDCRWWWRIQRGAQHEAVEFVDLC